MQSLTETGFFARGFPSLRQKECSTPSKVFDANIQKVQEVICSINFNNFDPDYSNREFRDVRVISFKRNSKYDFVQLDSPEWFFQGQIVNNVLSGLGYLSTKSGVQYEGSFLNGQYHGFGTYRYPNGEIYTGQIVGNQLTGRGTYQFANGRIYTGEFCAGQLHGLGLMKYHSGDVYDGQFDQGEMTGIGALTAPDGVSYQGQFVKGQFEGKGILSFKEHHFFEGDFKEGTPWGRGIVTFPNGDTYTGEMVKGKITGFGEMKMKDGSVRCVGDFVNGKLNGKGSLFHGSGNHYHGDCINGSPTGFGIFTFINGNIYTGEFCNGRMAGRGELIFSNKDILEGDFKLGVLEGIGTLHNPNGGRIEVRAILANDRYLQKFEKIRPPGLTYDLAIIRKLRSPKHQKGNQNVDNAPKTPTKQMTEEDIKAIEKELCPSPPFEASKKTKNSSSPQSPATPKGSPKKSPEQKKENSPLSDAHTCVICMEKPRNSFFNDCGHIVTCQECVTQCNSCPICRAKISAFTALQKMPKDPNCYNCLIAPINTVLIPCGHISFCNLCVKSGDQCPLCQTIVEIAKIAIIS